MKIVRFLVLSAAALLLAARADASLLTFTNLAAFQAAAGTTSLETFGSAAVGFSTANFAGSFTGFTLSSVANGDNSGIATGTIANSGNDFPIPAAFVGQNFYGWGNANGSVGPISTFQFAPGTTAFGFNWFNTDVTDTFRLEINAGTFVSPPFSLAVGPAASGFFGVVATGGETFTTAEIETNFFGGYISTMGLDDVQVGAAAAVPEPATMSLLAVGLGSYGLRKLRRRRA